MKYGGAPIDGNKCCQTSVNASHISLDALYPLDRIFMQRALMKFAQEILSKLHSQFQYYNIVRIKE